MSEEQKLIAEAVKATRKIERYLRNNGATGKGINELVNSIRYDLPQDIVNKILYCNHFRNKIVHDDHYDYSDDEDEWKTFFVSLKKIENYFEPNKPESESILSGFNNISWGSIFGIAIGALLIFLSRDE